MTASISVHKSDVDSDSTSDLPSITEHSSLSREDVARGLGLNRSSTEDGEPPPSADSSSASSNSDLVRLVAGGIAGMCAVAVGHPFDSWKVRIQIAKLSHIEEQSRSRGNGVMISTFKRMLFEEGVSSFFKGILSPLIVRFVVTGSFFAVNGFFKDLYINRYMQDDEMLAQGKDPILPLSVISAIGTLSGMVLAPVVTPAEMVKVQMQSDVLSHNVSNLNFKNFRDCLASVIRNRSLFRGYWITTARLAPGWGVYVWTYEGFNRVWDAESTLGKNDVSGSWKTTLRVILGGSLAGVTCWVASYPFDFVKTRVQSHPMERWNYLHTEKNPAMPLRVRDVVSLTYRKYGIRGFYRGLQPCVIRAVPVNLTQFYVYELVSFYLQNNPPFDE